MCYIECRFGIVEKRRIVSMSSVDWIVVSTAVIAGLIIIIAAALVRKPNRD